MLMLFSIGKEAIKAAQHSSKNVTISKGQSRDERKISDTSVPPTQVEPVAQETMPTFVFAPAG